MNEPLLKLITPFATEQAQELTPQLKKLIDEELKEIRKQQAINKALEKRHVQKLEPKSDYLKGVERLLGKKR